MMLYVVLAALGVLVIGTYILYGGPVKAWRAGIDAIKAWWASHNP